MSGYLLTPRAARDLSEIWNFVASRDGIRPADKVIDQLFDTFDRLAKSPRLGRSRLELLDDRHRFFRKWQYLVAYRFGEKPVLIVAIVHGARDLDRIFPSLGD